MKWSKRQGKGEPIDRSLEPEGKDQLEETAAAEIEYELHEWAGETRLVLDQLLLLKEVPHVWQGATLVVREEDEELVDQLIEEAETTSLPTLAPEVEKIEYDTSGWSDSEQASFSALLVRLGVPHEFVSGGGLLVEESDEEASFKKNLKSWNLKLIALIAICWSLFQLWYASPLPFILDFGILIDCLLYTSDAADE